MISMLSAADNALITQTDRDTPMGELFRRFWLPVLLPEEVPAPDSPPIRIKIMGEYLVAFRDSNGNVGIVEAFCPHRRAPLFYGRNEEAGLRCAYHGWKFDVNGSCVDLPSEPADSDFKSKVSLDAYPTREWGGVIWVYMGPPDERPPEPEWEFATVAPEQSYVSKRVQECNWLQAMEGGIDSSHVSFLHSGALNTDPLFKGSKGNQYNLGDKKPVFEVAESEGGLYIGARRNAEDGKYYWRITPWVMPCFTMVPPRGDHPMHGHFWVPMDDETCMAWSFDYHPVRALSELEREAMEAGKGIHVRVDKHFRPLQNKDNDYLMDRASQKSGRNFSGVEGIGMQDASLQESMGPIQDRTRENLVSTDNGIIMARHKLIKAAKELAAKGTLPPGRDVAHQKVRSVAVVLPSGTPFKEGAGEALKAREGVAQTSV